MSLESGSCDVRSPRGVVMMWLALSYGAVTTTGSCAREPSVARPTRNAHGAAEQIVSLTREYESSRLSAWLSREDEGDVPARVQRAIGFAIDAGGAVLVALLDGIDEERNAGLIPEPPRHYYEALRVLPSECLTEIPGLVQGAWGEHRRSEFLKLLHLVPWKRVDAATRERLVMAVKHMVGDMGRRGAVDRVAVRTASRIAADPLLRWPESRACAVNILEQCLRSPAHIVAMREFERPGAVLARAAIVSAGSDCDKYWVAWAESESDAVVWAGAVAMKERLLEIRRAPSDRARARMRGALERLVASSSTSQGGMIASETIRSLDSR